MRKKYGKFRVIFNSLTQTIPNKVVLNHIMTMELKAIINFGQAKMKLFMNIYNWRVSFPNEKIFLMLADITACFWFPTISADVTGAFGFFGEWILFSINGVRFQLQHISQLLGSTQERNPNHDHSLFLMNRPS
jgi:hypothetical protein